MIKVFTLNKNDKIELSKEELESLLNEAYYEGKSGSKTYVYTTPYYTLTNHTYGTINVPNSSTKSITVSCAGDIEHEI